MASSAVLQVILKAKDEASKTLDGSIKKIGGMGKVGKVAAGAGALIAGGIGAAAIALDRAADKAATYGGEIINIQRITGGSAIESSKLAAVFRRAGIDAGGAARDLKTLDAGIDGNSKYMKAAGIASKDASGHNRKSGDVMRDLVKYYSTATDKAKANTIASKLLGRGYKDMIPTLSGGVKGLDATTTAAMKNGEAMSGPQLQAVKDYAKAKKDAASAERGLTMQMGLLILPLKTLVTKWLVKFLAWMNESKGFANFKSWLKKVVTGITNFADSVKKWWASVKPKFDKFVAILKSQLKPAWDDMQKAFTKNPATMQTIKAVFIAVIAVLASITIASAYVWRAFAKVALVTENLRQKVYNGFSAMKNAILGMVNAVMGPIDNLLAKIAKLNPFKRNSPSLVDNVLAGTKVISKAYGGLGRVTVGSPTHAGASASSLASSSGGSVNEHHIYLDGRELSRALGRTVVHSERSGVR